MDSNFGMRIFRRGGHVLFQKLTLVIQVGPGRTASFETSPGKISTPSGGYVARSATGWRRRKQKERDSRQEEAMVMPKLETEK